ncbi:hypothetical protein [Gordonia sihwensis]|uniref:hypothetical protein n=1 Tax=Gordonia sihwensis TaxID=173559 RepID=UPI002416A58D|nr:hypothetical protein [Gordonia sihwensis]WFN91474.1 hypothetical protein P5P27_11845 [Gordonia sihwensis]WFN91532.1 hypothetical protein P5P27_12135 [Gordonia sihwensis]
MALIVGRLVAQLGLDDSGFTAGMGRAKTDIEKTSQAADKLADSSKSAAKAVEQIGDGAAKSQGRARTETERTTKATNDLAESAKRAEKATEQAATGAATAQGRTRTATDQTTQSTNRLSESARRAQTSVTQVGQGAASVRTVKGAADQATTATNGLAEAAGRAKAALATVGIGVGIGATIKAMTDSIGAARALGAQTNQMNVIFGDGKAKIEEWGQSASTTMRMSQREAQGAAIQFATFGRAMGLSGDQLVSFSKEQSKLAADLASFQGIPVAEAIQAMGSAYAGETETMRQYGVLIDDNTLKQTALAHGMEITGGNLTQVQKSQAIYLAMQEQLAYVNGDVERSNGKFGASLKTLTANLEETQAAVGEKLIPVVQPFIDLLSGPGLGAVEGIASAVGAAGSAFNSLPGPIQAALGSVVAFRVAAHFMGERVPVAGNRVANALRGVTAQTTVMSAQGPVQMGRFGSSVANLGSHVPILARMQSAFVNAAIGAERFPRAAGLAAGAMTGMKGAASGLIGALGGPWGLAIAGATAALGLWMQKKQADAQASEAAKARTMEYADALRESGGAIDSNIRNMVAKQMVENGMIDTAEKLGLSEQKLLDVVTQGNGAVRAFIPELNSMADAHGEGRDQSAKLALQMLKMSKEIDVAQSKAMQMAKATGDVKVSFDGSSRSAGAMSKAMVEFSESTDGAASKVDKLSKALNTLRDDRLTEEEALQASSSAIKDLAEAWGQVDAAAVKADGSINFDTPDAIAKYGALQDKVVDLGKTYDQTAAAAMEHARAENMGPAEALDYVRSKVDPLRQSLIDQATAAGVSAEAAERMADRYLGVPSEILTKLDLQGTEAAIAKLNQVQVKGAQPVEGKYTLVDNTPAVRAKLDEMKIKYSVIDGKLVISDEDAKKAQAALETLGVTTETLPDGFVKITDTSDANIARLKALGIEVQRLPDGTIVINPDDAEFWRRVTKAQEDGRKKIYVDMIQRGASDWEAEFHANLVQKSQEQGLSNANGSITEYASGGVRPAGVQSMPDQAVIEKGRGSGLVRWAEGETWWESYIPGAPSKRRRSTAILDETARRFGYALMPVDAMRGVVGLLRRGGFANQISAILSKPTPWISQFTGPRGPSTVTAFANGGVAGREPYGLPAGTDTGGYGSSGSIFPQWVHDLEAAFNVKASTYAGHQESSGLNKGIDWSGSVADMQRLAEYFVSRKSDMEQVIFQNPETGQQIGVADGELVGPGTSQPGYYRDDWAEHQNHVHSRQSYSIPAPGAEGSTGQQIQDVTLTSSSSRDDVARKIIAEGRKRGYTDDQIKAVLATAIQESNLDPNANGGGGAWHGIFQQDESYEGRDDPNTNITGFYDRLDEKRAADPDAEIYDQIFWLQQRPGESSAAEAVANGRQGYLTEIKSQDDAASKMLAELGPSVGTGTDSGSTSGSSVGSQVYVTGGHLDSVGTGYTPPASTPDTSASTTSTATDTGRKRLFTLGGGRIYNGNPEQPDVVKRLHGGTIPGTGRGDIIPMMGEPGEEVIRRDVATQPGVRAGLQHLNRTGRWPEFHADGGTVGGFTSGFGGYTDPAVAKVGILDHALGYYLEQLYRLGVAGYGGAAMAASAIGTDGTFQGLSTGSTSFPILDDIAQKLDEVIKEGRVGSIGIYVGEGGQIVVEDMGKLRQTQDKAVQDAMMRSAVMR